MKRDSDEYRKFAAEYEAKLEERKQDSVTYPYFCYWMFGWHRMDYITEEEALQLIKNHKMYETKPGCWHGYGREPIFISKRS